LSLSLPCASGPVGPFKAGISSQVSLWLAISLYQKSLCSISLPEWLSVDNLTEILAYERGNPNLWPHSRRLPFYYYEIAHRLRMAQDSCSHTKSLIFRDPSVSLLIQDIAQVRLDKLRQEFQDSLSATTQELQALVNGIASYELTLLKPFMIQALNDRQFLSESVDIKSSSEADAVQDNAPQAVALRRFRS
jgi:GINS complex protein